MISFRIHIPSKRERKLEYLFDLRERLNRSKHIIRRNKKEIRATKKYADGRQKTK